MSQSSKGFTSASMDPDNILRYDADCRLCGSDRVVTVLKLASTPFEDQFVGPEKLNIEQPLYPLDVALCENCGYLYLPYVVSPKISYVDYVYESTVTVGLRDHYDKYAREIVQTYSVPEGSLVVDLGSNDGSMLTSFQKIGMSVLGVEPAAAIARQATECGIPTIADFFQDDVCERIQAERGKARVVTANYMYANVDDVVTFTRSVRDLLDDDGIFVVQTGYHPEQMKINMFDYVYHEHFSYFTLNVLKDLFDRCDLQLLDGIITPPKGGSLRAIAQRRGGGRRVAESVHHLIEAERAGGVHEAKIYRAWGSRLESIRNHTRDTLTELKTAGKSIVGLGASHSTTTLIYHFDLGPFLDYIVDDNYRKHGMASPGLHIPVHSTQKLYIDAPDIVVLLAWQHTESILRRHAEYIRNGGVFLIPLPEHRFIDRI